MFFKRKKLNIAIVFDAITGIVAGSTISTQRLSKLLKKRGHKIIFISAKSPAAPANNFFEGMKVYRFFSLPMPRTEKQLYVSFPATSPLKKILREEKIDILYVIIPTPSAVTSIWAAKSLGIKIVLLTVKSGTL